VKVTLDPTRRVGPCFDFPIELEPAGKDWRVRCEFQVEPGDPPGGPPGGGGGNKGGWFLDISSTGRVAVGARGGDVLAEGKLPDPGGAVALELKRRTNSIRLVAGGRQVLYAAAPRSAGGLLGLGREGAVEVRPGRPQKVDRSDPVLLEDDFKRGGRHAAVWRAVRGSFSVEVEARPELSMSPFRCRTAAGAEGALALAGESFWDEYLVRAAVRLVEGRGEEGVGFCARGADDYWLLRLAGSTAGSPGAVELVRVRGGREKVVARRLARVRAGDWCALTAVVAGGRVVTFLDGVEALSHADAELTGGKVALWSRTPEGRPGGDEAPAPAEFDDILVLAHALAPTDLAGKGTPALARLVRRSARERTVVPSHYREHDPQAAKWADSKRLWRFDANGVWMREALAGDGRVVWDGREDALEAGRVELALHANGTDFASGYRLAIDANAELGRAVWSLFERDKKVAAVVRPITPERPLLGAELERRGGALVARAGEEVVFRAPDTLALARGHLGLRRSSVKDGARRVRLREIAFDFDGWLDTTFSRQPAAFLAASGEWRVRPRWACDQAYTFYGGVAPGRVSALWLKARARGDVCAEIFAAPGMAVRPAPFYDSPIHLAITLGATGRDLATGYTLICGGPDRPTKLLRRGEVVAQSARLVRPDLRVNSRFTLANLHRKWTHLRLERRAAPGRGALVVGLVDGEEFVRFADPEPLDGGGVAFWSLGHNRFMIARCRVNALSLEPATPLLEDARPPVDPMLGLMPIKSKTHPLRFYAFESGTAPVRSLDGNQGARVELAVREPGESMWTPDRKHVSLLPDLCVRLVNESCGGSFAASLIDASFDATELPRLAFDYRCAPEAKVNLYFLSGGERWRVALSGREDEEGGPYRVRSLGRLPDFKADGAWRRAEVPILGLLAAARPGAGKLLVDDVVIGNYERSRTLQAGFGGNGALARVEIDNLLLGGVGGAKADVEIPSLVRDSTRPRFECDRKTFGGGPVEIAVRDESGLDPRSVRVAVGGRNFHVDGRALRYDAWRGVLVFDARATALAFKKGDVPIELSGRDLAGRSSRRTKFAPRFDPALDQEGPAVEVVAPAPLAAEDFANSLDAPAPWRAFGGEDGARLSVGCEGTRAFLRCENARTGGTAGVLMRELPFDTRRYSAMSFDVRVWPETHVNLQLHTSRRSYELHLTDGAGGRRETTLPEANAAADRAWRTVRVDLNQVLRAPGAGAIVRRVTFADLGPSSNGTRGRFDLARVRLWPCLAARRVRFAWRGRDPSGLADASYLLDREARTVPDEEGEGLALEKTYENLAPGVWYFHVRMKDRAGNWGASAHHRIEVRAFEDVAPPALEVVSPRPGAKACPDAIRCRVTDAGAGISGHDVVLTVNGRVFTAPDRQMQYRPATGDLLLDLARSDGRPFAPDGAPVRCRLEAVDRAGNRAKPVEWTWSFAHAAEGAGRAETPRAPRVTCVPDDCVVFSDFERDTFPAREWRRGLVWRVPDGWRSAGAVRLAPRSSNDGGAGHVEILPGPFDLTRYPVLEFDYRVKHASPTEVRFVVAGENAIVGFGKTKAGNPDCVATVEPLARDGAWHHLRLDLRVAEKRLRERFGAKRPLRVGNLQLSVESARGLEIDNLCLSNPRARGAAFLWDAPPLPSGVAGYAVALDREPDTVPAEAGATAMRAQYGDLAPGRYWFHVRARSNAGRWSATAHLPLVVEE